MFLLKKILAARILPPTGPVLLALFGVWLTRTKSRRWQHRGAALAAPSPLAYLLPGGMVRSRPAFNEYLGQLYNRL